MFDEAITLAYQMSVGEALRYKTEVLSTQSIKEDGQAPQTAQSQLEITMLQTVKGVSPDGQMTVDVTIEKGTMQRDGQVMTLPTVGQTITIVMKKSGEIVRTSVDFPFSQPAFPERSVKLKDSWTGDSKMDIPLYDNDGNQTGSKQVTLTYNYTLNGFEHVLGYETAAIHVNCPTETIALQENVEQKITAKGVTNFGHKQGRLVRSRVETETEITAPGASVSTAIRVTVELIEAKGPEGGGGSLPGSDEMFLIR
jgi:hypothetical protein